MRVLRTLDLAGGEYRRKIEFLMSEKGGGFSKGEMTKFLETPGFASRLLDDDLYLSIDKLQANRYAESRDDLVQLLSTPALSGAVQKDDFFASIERLLTEGYATADGLVRLLSTPSFAYAVQKDNFFASIERLLSEGYATVDGLVRLLSTPSFAYAVQKDNFFASIERLLTEGYATADGLVRLLSTRSFANAIQKDDFFASIERLLEEGHATIDALVRLLSTPSFAYAVQKDDFFVSIERLLTEGHATADGLVRLLSTRSFANAIQKDDFFASIERLLEEGYATIDALVRLLSTPSFAYAVQKDDFFASIERLLEEGYATADALVRLLSTPSFANAVQKDGFFPAVQKLLEEGHVTIAVMQKALSQPNFASVIQKDGFFSALATLEQNHGFRKRSEALSHLFLQSHSFALVMSLRSEFFSRIHFLEELGFSPMQIAKCLGSRLNVAFKRLTEPENSSEKYEARHANNLKWLVTSIANGGPGLSPQDLHRMFFSNTPIPKEKLAKIEALELPIFRDIIWLAIAMHRQYRHGSSFIAGQSRHKSSVATAYLHLAIEFADCVGKTYSLSFSGQKLGLSLRSVTVDKVLDKSLTTVGKGDRIVAVGNAVVTASAGAKTIAGIIRDAERPLRITFCKN